MEPRTNSHPVYVSGQYLTSENLNETHNFLWQEEKATRYLLAGNGIAQGLNADFTGAGVIQKITVSKGAASTTDGYIIQATQNTVFDKTLSVDLVLYQTLDDARHIIEQKDVQKIADSIKPNSSKSLKAFELFIEGTPANNLPDNTVTITNVAITVNDALSNYFLLAWVFLKDTEYDQCQQGDCNSRGTLRNYSVRYFFITSNLFPAANAVSPELFTCSAARIKNLSASGSKAGLIQKSFAAWTINFTELLPYFFNDPNRQLKTVATLLGADDTARLATSTNTFNQINQSVNNTNCPQYYNLFAVDLAKAINELVLFYNDYAKSFPVIAADRLEQAVIIGGLRQSGFDGLRYHFIQSPDLVQGKASYVQLKKLFRRVLALVDNFIPLASIQANANSVQNKPLAIPSLVGDALLQDCSIPYYFDIKTLSPAENNILKYWSPNGGNLKNVFSYYDSAVVSRADMAGKLPVANWYSQNFFRIEGHIGLAKQTAINALNSLIRTEGLPIQLIDCDVNYKGPQKWIDWYTNFATNVSTYVKNLRKDYKEYDFSPIKKIQDGITQTSYRSVDDVVKIYNDFNAYSGVFYNTPAVGAGLKKAQSKSALAAKGIPDTAYDQYKTVVTQAQIDLINKDFKEAYAEQNDLQASKLVTLADLTDLEYLGGAVRGGTFVLLHDGTNVIGDGSLPYYYRINFARVYNL